MRLVSHQCLKDEVRSGDKNARTVCQCEDGQVEHGSQAHIHHTAQQSSAAVMSLSMEEPVNNCLVAPSPSMP